LLRTELRAVLRLAIPAALTQVGAMMLGIVDAVMVGRVGVAELDAAALGNLIGMGTMIFGMGCVFGMDPVATQAEGAGNGDRVGRTLQRGIVLAVLCALPIMASWGVAAEALRALGQDPELSGEAGRYLSLQVFSVAPFLVFQAQRQYLQARGIVAPALWVVLAANVFNIVANWALIFGHLGFPAMGLEGAAWATGLSRVVQCIGLALWIRWRGLHRGAWVPWSAAAFELRGLREILAHGIPVGLQFGLEMWAFQGASLLAGLLGETPLAAHIIVLNLASVSFMLPLGVSIAAATRVGNLVGAGKFRAAQRSAWIALALGGSVMTGSAVIFISAQHLLPRLFTSDPGVLALAASLLPIAAAFQLFDGVQVVGGGILRGLGSTRPVAVFNLVGYYVLALPVGAALALTTDVGVAGLWWGLAMGLAVVSVCLVVWIARRGPAYQGAKRAAGGTEPSALALARE